MNKAALAGLLAVGLLVSACGHADKKAAGASTYQQAVAFAKGYSTDEAGRLVNGILGRIQREEAARR